MIVLAAPAVLLIRAGGILLPAFGCLILGLLLVCFAGTSASTLPALFPTRLRYGALSLRSWWPRAVPKRGAGPGHLDPAAAPWARH